MLSKLINGDSACINSLPLSPNLLPNYTFPITTNNKVTQQYFDQAIVLAAAFNHDEGVRSCNMAISYDNKCAMCYWAISYSMSININRDMTSTMLSLGQESIQTALELINNNSMSYTQKEIDLINVMALRFSMDRNLSNGDIYEQMYSNAMYNISQIYNNDPTILSMYGQSLMDLMPWNYYITPTQPKNATYAAINAFERALSINPNNPFALHLHIHILEASSIPAYKQKLNTIANRLHDLIPHNQALAI